MLVIISSFQEKTPSRQPGNRYSVLEIKTDHHSPDFAKSYGFCMAPVGDMWSSLSYGTGICHCAFIFFFQIVVSVHSFSAFFYYF